MTMNDTDRAKQDNVKSVRIIPTEGQKRFAISGASIGLLIAGIGTIAAVLSVPLLQPYLNHVSSPSPDTRLPEREIGEILPKTEPLQRGSAAQNTGPTSMLSPKPTVEPQVVPNAPTQSEPSAAAVDTPASPAQGTKHVASPATDLRASPDNAPLKAVLNNAFPDGAGGVKVVVTLYAPGGEVLAYAPHLTKGHVRNWSITDISAGASCYTRSDWMGGLPVHNDGRDESLQSESKAVSSGGATFTATFSCDRKVNSGDSIAIALEVMSVSGKNRTARSSFNGTASIM